jgi:hypothetical protein
MKIIIAEAEAVILKAPYHGGDAYSETNDIDQGIELISPKISEDDPEVVLKHNSLVLKGIQNGRISIKSVSFVFYCCQAVWLKKLLGDNTAYSYLTGNLASKGYFVISIQHELPTDDLMLTTGIPQVVRRPFWDRGVENILFVLNSFKKSNPQLDYRHLILIGHSNGADMTALFAQKYPEMVDKISTLDNRRMALPRVAHPKIYSLRSSDQPADEGVLPTQEARVSYGIRIIKLPNTIHNDMNDRANTAQRKEINDYILGFLND